jgi:hypothetical protein
MPLVVLPDKWPALNNGDRSGRRQPIENVSE